MLPDIATLPRFSKMLSGLLALALSAGNCSELRPECLLHAGLRASRLDVLSPQAARTWQDEQKKHVGDLQHAMLMYGCSSFWPGANVRLCFGQPWFASPWFLRMCACPDRIYCLNRGRDLLLMLSSPGPMAAMS